MKKFLGVYLGAMHDENFKKWMAMPEAERKQKEGEGMAAWGKWMQDRCGWSLGQDEKGRQERSVGHAQCDVWLRSRAGRKSRRSGKDV